MTESEVNFNLHVDQEGDIKGFSITTWPDTDAKLFCDKFYDSFLKGETQVAVGNEAIGFSCPTFLDPIVCAHHLSGYEVAKLKEFFILEHPKRIEQIGYYSPGLRIWLN